jgi:hypothetical protein
MIIGAHRVDDETLRFHEYSHRDGLQALVRDAAVAESVEVRDRGGGWALRDAWVPVAGDDGDHIVSAVEAFEMGRPELFWSVENLRASCVSCNSAGGGWIGGARRRDRRRRERSAEAVARRWAEQENAYWRDVELPAGRPALKPMPRIY